MTAETPRTTNTSTVSRTAAATAARRLKAAQRAAMAMGLVQVELLDDRHLIALTVVMLAELERRGIIEPADVDD